MPKQNRVTPFGEIIFTPARGELMGNRGCLHNDRAQIIRPHQNKRWIICQLQFNGSFVALHDKQPYLVFQDFLWAWSPEGYGPRTTQPADRLVQVLTPRSIVRTLAKGYEVAVHSSALQPAEVRRNA